MAGQIVQMDYAVIGDVSKGFNVASQTLKVISTVLQALVASLRAASFASFGTSAALAQYYDVIRQKIDKLSKVCDEFSGDLSNAINDHKKGDVQGKRYFGEGVQR